MPTSEEIEQMKIELQEQERALQEEARVREQMVQDSLERVMQAQKSEVEGYYLVLGCFKERSNADAMYEKLIKKGCSAKQIEMQIGYTMVAIGGYRTFTEAYEVLFSIGEDDICPYDVWVYDSKDGLHK